MVEQQVSASTKRALVTPLRVNCVTDLEQFNAMAGDWERLVERSGVDPVFMSHTWLRTWLEHFGGHSTLHLLTVHEGDELIAAAPLVVSTGRMYGLKVRRLESIYNYHTPRFDFLIACRHEEVYRLLWKTMSDSTQEWDVVVLSQVPADSPTLDWIEQLARTDGWNPHVWNARPSPYIPLHCDFESLMSRFKGKERYNLRKRQEKLSGLGELDFEVVDRKELVREAMEEGIRIEAAAWKGENGTAINSDAAVREFYVRFAERAADLGWMRLCFLRVGGKRVAFNYLVEKDSKAYGVKIGYDPEYHSYSPGHLLLLQILQRACANNYSEYDFLGVDDEWKYMWTKEVRHHKWLFLFRNSLRSKLLYSAKFHVVPRIKHLRSLIRGE